MKLEWKVKRVSDIATVVNGGTPDTTIKDFWSGDILWITPKDMGKLSSIYVDDTERKITTAGLKNSSAKIIPPNSIILSSRAPIGHLAINNYEITTNQGCKGIIPKKEILTKYLFYFLKNSIDLLNSLGTGTTFKELSSTKLNDVEVPFPPLPEQQRIVEILDQSFAAIDQANENTEKNLEKISNLWASYSENIFIQLSMDYPVLRFPQLCKLERGSSPRPIKNFITKDESGVKWIKIGDASKSNKYIYSTQEKITTEGEKKSRYVKEGDLLLTNSMTYGKAYIMKTDGYIHDGWFVIKPNDSVMTEYFWHTLSSPNVKKQFHLLASGAIVKNISSDLVNKVVLPLPPKKIQIQISEKLDLFSSQLQAITKLYQKKLELLTELKQSILHKAFQGEL
jgi:type I restriction enzyme S subunit